MAGEKVETFEDIKTKTVLEDSDLDLIAEQANKELAEEAKAKEEPKVEEEDPKEKEGAPKEETAEEELSPEEKATQEAEEKRKEDERILAAKDEELKDDEKTRKAELLKSKEEADKKALDEDVKAIAKEYEITEEEARQSLEHVSKLREKYKDNAKELAKANYFQQRFISKQTEELKALKSAPAVKELNIENVIGLLDKGELKTVKGDPITREMVIEAYRKANADTTETVDDETVLKMAAKDYIKGHEARVKAHHSKMQSDATAKRSELIKSIPAEFLPEIEPIIKNTPDSAILDKGFSIEDTIFWAKGKRFDQAVKEAEERGFKRGQEKPKILGEKPKDGGKPPVKKAVGLSAADKKRALEMFDGQDISDEKKFELFAEIKADEANSKKKKE